MAQRGNNGLWNALAETGQKAEPLPNFYMEVVSVSAARHRQKRVFIYHTHTFEAYEIDPENKYDQTEKWRTADWRYNVIRIGEELKSQLQNAGVFVTHDTGDYESPRLSSAYARSLIGLREAAETGYDLYIDLHRDSYSKGNGPNTVTVDGTETARVLILIGQGTGSSLEEKPDWEANQRVAQIISDALNERAEGLCRGVSLKSGRYNQQAASPSMLIEVGNNKNILPEAVAAAEPLAWAICRYLDTLD
ncbi:MAG: stage II sporulation protein P [Clostridia bacterium]|nr:stage II sporulation protein P [Clostridia bacterium]